MFKATLDWDKAHERTRAVEVTQTGTIVELDADEHVLRSHTLLSIFDAEEYSRPITVAQPGGFPQPAAAMPTTVELDSFKFEQLLGKLKAEANKQNNHAKLTSMEIHEQLLAMKHH